MPGKLAAARLLEGTLPMSQAHSECTDEMLMVRYKRGDRDAFIELVRRYERAIFNFARRYVISREGAADVTQETFLRVVKRSTDFRHESRLSTWLFSIARNLCVDELRKRRHRSHVSLEQPNGNGEELKARLSAPSSPHTLDGERGAANREMQQAIASAVDELPDDQREVFLLRQLGGVPFSEIASMTQSNENTVKSRMRYALDHLRERLVDFEEYARALR